MYVSLFSMNNSVMQELVVMILDFECKYNAGYV